MGVETECTLLVLGQPYEIGRWEATQTARTRAALATGYPGWSRGGWPSLEIRRLSSADDGRAAYHFDVVNGNPLQWVSAVAHTWPTLEFRAECVLDRSLQDCDDVVYYGHYRGGARVADQEITSPDCDLWETEEWLANAGFTPDQVHWDHAVSLPLSLEDPARALAVVRAAMAHGPLAEGRRVLIEATVTQSIGYREALDWVLVAGQKTESVSSVAIARVNWLAQAIDSEVFEDAFIKGGCP